MIYSLRQCNVIVTNITFDGCPTNFLVSKSLGCTFESDKSSTCLKSRDGDHPTFVFPDPSHMVKLIRNFFDERKQFVNRNNELIDFSYLVKLNALQENEGLHLGNNTYYFLNKK